MKIKFLLYIFIQFLSFNLIGQDFLETNKIYLEKIKTASDYRTNKLYKNAISEYEKAFLFSKKDIRNTDLYSIARVYSLSKNKNKAFFYLNEAIKHHYSDYKNITNNKDFGILIDDKRWNIIIGKVLESENRKKYLSTKLEEVIQSDQKYRVLIDSSSKKFGISSPQVKELFSLISETDSLNLIIVKELIDSMGWPGFNQVGINGSVAVFLVIQHADLKTQEKYLPLFIQSARKGEALWQNYALLVDRILYFKGEKQLYGTQIIKYDDKSEFVPIFDEPNVNFRRKLVGFPPIENEAKRYGIKYPISKSD